MDASLVGRRLGEFVVREELSAGGFGTVFRAEQPALAREAVIKVMHTRLRASERLIQRFLREARLASRLDHPYAAHMYAFGAEPDGVLWIAMELVRGTPLDRLLETQGRIPLERFVPLIERICQVVHTAHDQGIVHRDLKPANVMVLARAGQLLPKLIDLGIAKISSDDITPVPATRAPRAASEASATPRSEELALGDTNPDADVAGDALAQTATPASMSAPDLGESGGRLTEEGAIMGSPLYMAPEQWTDAATVDARTDIYALGVMSFELLTGKPPFSAPSRYHLALAHAGKEIPRLGGDLPPALDAVIARALAKKPSDRYHNALELAAAFRSASGLVDEPVTLPRLADATRTALATRAPQPLAQAAAALEAARNAHQARDAIWQLVRVSVRLVALVALSAHSHVGSRRGDARATDAVRRLRRRALPDAEWLAIARELVAPFAKLRDAHPLPELVDFFTGTTAAPLTELLALRDTSGDAGDDAVRDLLAAAMPLVEKMVTSLAFLFDYRIVVPRDGSGQLWAGLRRSEPVRTELRGRTVGDGQPVIADPSGVPVVTLWPFVQVHEPARGAGPRLFFLEGSGRRGARLVALPEPFEHEDEALWEVVGALADDTAGSTSIQEECPYPGLAAFTADHASMFFGRERETEEIVNRLRTQPLLAVVGPSGAGKSSFVQAGMLPNLPEDWEVVVLRPGAAPLVSLGARLGKLGLDPQVIQAQPASLRGLLHARGKPMTVIVVDQFEELFTLCDQPAERDRFVNALVAAARSGDDPVRIVLTLRDDFLLHAEGLPALRARLAPALHLLTTPNRDDLLRILTEPLKRASYELDDPALAGEIVDSLAGARSALALLSFTASKLWELRDRRFHQLSRKAYASLGGVAGALAKHAEATLDAMLPDEQRLVREVFRHAVTAEGTRAVLARTELDQLLGDSRHGPTVIEKLVAARLLVSSEGPTGVEQIELTHEALITAWPRLVTWRGEDAEGVRMRDQLRTIARQWEERGKPTGLLWRGDALAEYRIWRARYTGALTDLETAFAAASHAEASRSQRRRRALVAGSFVVLAAGMVALGVLNRQATQERAAAERSEENAQDKAAQLNAHLLESYEAQARQYLLGGDYQRALAYLDEAAKLGARGPAHDLVAAFVANGVPGKERVFGHDSSVVDARFSPDGTRVVTAGMDNRARVWSVADGRLIAELHHGGAVTSAWFLPDDSILTASDDGTAVLWDAGTGNKLSTFDPHVANVVVTVAVPSPDARMIVTVSSDDSVRLWDRTGKLVHELRPAAAKHGSDFAHAAAFSSDGARVAVGDHDGGVHVWDARTGSLVGNGAGHQSVIVAIAWSPDGAHLVTASIDRSAIVWDAQTVTAKVHVHHDDPVNDATFAPDGKRFATASNDRTARIWDAATGDAIATLAGHLAGVNVIKYSPDGKQLATASDDGTVMLWDAASGRRVSHLVGHEAGLFTVQYDARGDRLISSSIDRNAIVWSAAPQVRAQSLLGHKGRVSSVSTTPDDATVVTGGEDGTVRLWETATGKQQQQLPITGADVTQVEVSPDGKRLATGDEHGVRIWELATSRLIATIPTGPANAIDWARDSSRLVVASDDALARVCTSDGRVIASLKGHVGDVMSAAFSPDGERVITTSHDHTSRVWRAATGEPLARWDGDILGAAYDPTGELVLGRYNSDVTLWRADDPAHHPVAQLKHDALVFDAHWSSHGDFIVTSSVDATVRIWDRAGHLLAMLGDGHTQWWHVRFSHDDRHILGVSRTGGMVWDIPAAPANLRTLFRCKVYELVDDKLIRSSPPPGCT